MEVAADPQPLVDDRELLDLLVEPGVVDRDAGVAGEHLDELLVVLAELAAPILVGQVEVARRSSPATRIGTPSSECIGGWCGGKPCDSGCREMSGIRSVAPSRMIVPRRPWPCGSGPISARSSSEIPLVMNRSMRPRSSKIPRAAYRAPDEVSHADPR